eukprot:SAG31_NODE_3317_length_4424_cov_3.662197_1_plen_104_part_00
MIRIPDAPRFELRLADGATNPYLFPAVVIAAGMAGVAAQTDPGPLRLCNMYSNDADAVIARGECDQLPLYLAAALQVRFQLLFGPCVRACIESQSRKIPKLFL